jgi:hypothetical protein
MGPWTNQGGFKMCTVYKTVAHFIKELTTKTKIKLRQLLLNLHYFLKWF